MGRDFSDNLKRVAGKGLGLAVLWLLLAVPLAVLPAGNDYVLQPKTASAMAGVLVLVALLFFDGSWFRSVRSPVLVPLAFLLGASALSIPSSVNTQHALRHFMEQAGWAAVCLVAAAGGMRIGKTAAVLSLGCLIQLVIAVLQLNGIWITGHGELFGTGRIYGSLGNPGFLAVFIAPACVIVFSELVYGVRRRDKRFILLYGAGFAASLFLLWKAAVVDAWAGLALGGAVVVALEGWKRDRPPSGGRSKFAWLGAFVFAALGLLAAAGVLLPRLNDRVTYLKVKAFSWHAAAWLARENPLMGGGPGSFQLESPRAMSSIYQFWIARWNVPKAAVYPHDEAFAHQDYLQLFAEAGVVGLGIFIWLLVAAIRSALSVARRAAPQSREKAACVGALAAFVPTMAFHFPLHLASSQVLFWLCLGWASAGREEYAFPRENPEWTRRISAVLPIAAVLAAAVVARGLAANVLTGHGYRIFRSGAPSAAVGYFEKSEKMDPVSFEERFYSGAAYQALGDYAEALRQYDIALMLYPGMQGAIYNRGNIYYVMGRHESAIAEYDRALEINPCLVDALNNRGNAFLALGRYREAISDYLEAVSLMPGKVEATYNLGYAYYSLGSVREASKWVGRALDLDPGYEDARNLAARLGLKPK